MLRYPQPNRLPQQRHHKNRSSQESQDLLNRRMGTSLLMALAEQQMKTQSAVTGPRVAVAPCMDSGAYDSVMTKMTLTKN
jgi:hypothetical protein